ncbi:hypothetical protein [Streptomyces mirabilis]|uniref:hypothetical protein n=1 Tax=Streptomyces mirabilis TaxID=68239 RepID=UPI0036A7113D
MVNAGTYPLWQQLAVAEGLPDEALPAVIEALCAPARAIHDVYDRREEWRKKAFADALPALLRRTTDPALRRRPLEQADDGQLADLAGQGVVTAADLPAILRTHRPTPGLVTGLARHPGQVDDAIGLLCHLHDTDLERVVSEWRPRRYRADAGAFPPVPPALLDAVLEYALTPLARILDNLGEHPGWEISQRPGLGLPHEFGEGAPWRILATCPERWPELVDHPTLGKAVQHLLLDHAEAEQDLNRQKAATGSSFLMRGIRGDSEQDLEPGLSLDAGLLEACLPACPVPAGDGRPAQAERDRPPPPPPHRRTGALQPPPPRHRCRAVAGECRRMRTPRPPAHPAP